MENSAKVVSCKIFKSTSTKERIFQESLSLREDIYIYIYICYKDGNHRFRDARGPPDSPLSTEPTETGIAKAHGVFVFFNHGNFRGYPQTAATPKEITVPIYRIVIHH